MRDDAGNAYVQDKAYKLDLKRRTETVEQEFLAEVERRAGANVEQMRNDLDVLLTHRHEAEGSCSYAMKCVGWLRRILGDK